MDSASVEELTRRLPPSQLAKIIRHALDCGRRNVPFTERDLLGAVSAAAASGSVPDSSPEPAQPAPSSSLRQPG